MPNTSFSQLPKVYNNYCFDEVILQQCLNILTKSRSLISDPKYWSKKSSWSDPFPDSHSAYDAVEVCVFASGYPKTRIFDVIDLLKEYYYPKYKSLSDFNARTTHAEILEMFNFAVLLAEQKLTEITKPKVRNLIKNKVQVCNFSKQKLRK